MKQQNICPTTRDRTDRPQHVSNFSCVKRKKVKNPKHLAIQYTQLFICYISMVHLVKVIV